MAAQRRSYRSFLQHLNALETAITDPGGLATLLYQEGLIDRLAWQRADNTLSLAVLERSRELLQKVEVKIENEEEAFDKFLSILSRDPSMEDICRRLRTTLSTYACTHFSKGLPTNFMTTHLIFHSQMRGYLRDVL